MIGRGAYGEIWLARTVTGAFRAVKVVYRSTFESERAFDVFKKASSLEPENREYRGRVIAAYEMAEQSPGVPSN